MSGAGRRLGERVGVSERLYQRKPAEELKHPDRAANGPPIAELNKRLRHCPMLARLREIGAPLFEDMARLPLPAQIRRKA